jgi:hypothetical protein
MRSIVLVARRLPHLSPTNRNRPWYVKFDLDSIANDTSNRHNDLSMPG